MILDWGAFNPAPFAFDGPTSTRMMPLLLALVVTCHLAIASAQDAVPPSPPPLLITEATTTPAPNPRYQSKPGPFNACRARVAEAAGKPCDLIFIGDSVTDRWLGPGKDVWERRYAPRHALNFGCFADQTQNVLWRLDHMDIASLRPRVAVVLIGTNNSKDRPEAIAAGVKSIILRTQALFPGIATILVSIMPNQRAQEVMMATNAIIRGYADGQTVFWLDLVPLMVPVTTITENGKADSNWRGLGNDHLHPDASGYELWSDAMEPLLNRLLTADPVPGK
jgi:lysophospholipase L1-like esterase